MATTESFHEGMHLSGDIPLIPGEEGSPMTVSDSEDPEASASKKRKADAEEFMSKSTPPSAAIVKLRKVRKGRPPKSLRRSTMSHGARVDDVKRDTRRWSGWPSAPPRT